ncbi:TonB family protein [Porticoccus sp. W117]|uniref:TonB family protein n=1 Tax=Porticoccus sp. W117 TaxID=3054777 RepID=UPI00259880C6|nr:TonB family protein [Porticoccus sp. W117]MDM3869982.1 TonB family protein [Porticoccus sp. W117]
MKNSRLLSLLAACVVSLCSNFSMADASSLILNGASSYRDLGNDKFLAALYLELPSNNYENIISTTTAKRMEMRLTSSYSKRRWVNLWMQSIAISNSNKTFNSLAEPLVELFNQQKGGLEPGDIVSIQMTGDRCSYQVNGVTLAEDLPGGLFNLFANAWIGKAPPSTDFRNAMLGKDVDTDALHAQLAQIQPGEARINAITEWIAPPEPEIDEGQLLAEQKAAEEAAALAAAEAEKERTLENDALPTHAMLVPSAEPDATAIALAAAKKFVEQQTVEQAAEPEIDAESVAAAEEVAEEEFSVSSALAVKDYIRGAKKQIHKSLRYPNHAQQRGYQGQVRLTIEVDRNGELVNVAAAEQSPHKTLDRAAIRAVKKAAPYEPLPQEIIDETLSLTIPFKFTLVER